MRFFRRKPAEPRQAQPADRMSDDLLLTHSIDSGGVENLLAQRRSQTYQIVPARQVEHGSYDLEVMQRHILELKSLAGTMERRGRDLTSFWNMVSQAESYLKRGPQFSGEAHRFGYSAMLYLNDARVGRGGGSALCTLTPARNYGRAWDQCDFCGLFNTQLKFCDDFLCVHCFADEVATMLVTEAYWIAPNDQAYVPLSYVEAKERGYRDAERVLDE
jgi:hypothetical protein